MRHWSTGASSLSWWTGGPRGFDPRQVRRSAQRALGLSLRIQAGAVAGGLVAGLVLSRSGWASSVQSAPTTAGELFSHNLIAMAPMLVGLITFGWGSVLALGAECMILGGQVGIVFGSQPTSVALAGIAPHGIFELVALALAAAAGMVPLRVWGSTARRRVTNKPDFIAILVLLGLALGTLALAAGTEAHVTPVILGWTR